MQCINRLCCYKIIIALIQPELPPINKEKTPELSVLFCQKQLIAGLAGTSHVNFPAIKICRFTELKEATRLRNGGEKDGGASVLVSVFRRNILLPSSGLKHTSPLQTDSCTVGTHQSYCTAL